jgi:hypothetical protein
MVKGHGVEYSIRKSQRQLCEIKGVHAKHVRDGFESLLTFEAKSGDFAVPGDNLCVHTIKDACQHSIINSNNRNAWSAGLISTF